MRHVNQFLSKLLVIGAVVLAGCATQPPVVTSNLYTPPPVSIPVITPTNLQNMKYTLVTSQTIATFDAELKANPNAQYYVLDRTNMEIMISNTQEMRRYILSQQASINYLAGALNLETSKSGASAPNGASAPSANVSNPPAK
jgi:hypothetical protein